MQTLLLSFGKPLITALKLASVPRTLIVLAAAMSLLLSSTPLPADALTMIVMDPLAKPLSCPCVEGYAQRDYERLADYLERELDQEVTLVFSESLIEAVDAPSGSQADLVIGKHSVVVADAEQLKLQFTPMASLTDLKGSTTQTGLVVVRSNDPAESVGELNGYRILFGPAECDEKHAAVIDLLRKADVPIPSELEITQACSDGACKIIEWGDQERAAAVISSYAQPLLEGCGTIEKGGLRVIGESEPVSFITVFANEQLSEAARQSVRKALLNVHSHAEIALALESMNGFVAYQPESDPDAGKKN